MKSTTAIAKKNTSPKKKHPNNSFLIIPEKYIPARGINKIQKDIAAKDRRIKKLKEELAAARADALSSSQEQQAFSEELQSANEEVLSSNEELQTLNEELETSKEEIEAANEELIASNQELQTRNEMLNESYEYA